MAAGAPLTHRERLMALWAAALLLTLAAAAVPQVHAQPGEGVGVAPSNLDLTDPPVLRSGSKVGTLHFQQHDYASATVQLRVQPPPGSARDASPWLVIDPAGTVEVPRTSDYPVEVRVEVPATAANGEYRARVTFQVVNACESDGACASVNIAATANIIVQVGGDQVVRLLVQGSPVVRHVEEGEVFQVSVPLENAGNVDVRPAVRVEIEDKHREEVLVTRWANGTLLRPGEGGQRTFLIEDLGLPVDQYWAIISVFVDDELIRTLNAQTFQVVEPGSLLRSAELRTIRIEGDLTRAAVGDLVKLTAVVDNTGQAPIRVVFKGEVFVDGTRVDVFESDPRDIPVGAQGLLDVFYRVATVGQHEFRGQALYGGALTAERTVLLSVPEAGGGGPFWVVLAGTTFLVVVLGVIGYAVVQHRRRGPSRASRARRGPPSRPRGARPPRARPPASRGTRAPAGGGRPRAPPPKR